MLRVNVSRLCERISAILEEVREDKYLTPHKLDVTAARLQPILFPEEESISNKGAPMSSTEPVSTAMSPLIEKALKEVNECREDILKCTKAAEVVKCAKALFPELVTRYDLVWWPGLETKLFLRLVGMNDVYDVVPLLRYLAQNGFRSTGRPLDYPIVDNRDWPCGRITVCAYFGSKTRCRFVKVGENAEPPRAVYELQCDGVPVKNERERQIDEHNTETSETLDGCND